MFTIAIDKKKFDDAVANAAEEFQNGKLKSKKLTGKEKL